MAQWGTLLVLSILLELRSSFCSQREIREDAIVYIVHTAYILNFDFATCAKMQHGTTSTIFNSTFDFVHRFLLFVFFTLPPLTESAATYF